MRAVHKRYHRELLLAMAIYVVLMFASVWLLKRIDGIWLRTVVTLLPVLPTHSPAGRLPRCLRQERKHPA